jgi:hypothetical protein
MMQYRSAHGVGGDGAWVDMNLKTMFACSRTEHVHSANTENCYTSRRPIVTRLTGAPPDHLKIHLGGHAGATRSRQSPPKMN